MYKEELHNLYSVLSVIRLIQSRFMRQMGYSAHMREIEMLTIITVKKPKP